MLTKKYYEMLARSIKGCEDMPELLRILCIRFGEDNPRFSKQTFLEACDYVECALCQRITQYVDGDEYCNSCHGK